MPENIFNERIASKYDYSNRSMFDNDRLSVISLFLAELAGNFPALEFAIGTGRVALPLQALGTEVYGIELSQPMIDQLMAKSGGKNISVVAGDMASTKISETFNLVYLVYNTITNLITQDEQVECFKNAASHLRPGGYFVIEDQIPSVQDITSDNPIRAFDVTAEHIGIDKIDTARQIVVSHHYWIESGAVEMFQSTHRYSWPAEYDLMARIARLELFERWGDWDKSEFTSESKSHISVWRKLT